MKILPLMAALLALPFSVCTAYADDDVSAITVSGFGTAAFTRSDTNDARFGRPAQPTGVGTGWKADVDSNLGLQATAKFNAMFSATGQLLARKSSRDDIGLELNLGFLKARLSDSFSVRVGRLGLPVYMISDYRNVGYANTMIRPPSDVYSQVTLDALDGVDAIYQHSFGETTLTGQLGVGVSKSTIGTGPNSVVTVDAKRLTALNLTAENGPLTLRFGRSDTRITIDDSAGLNGLVGGLRAAGSGFVIPAMGDLATRLEVKDKKASFTSIGLALDWHNIVVQSEFAKRRTDSYINNTSSAYLMAGYRVGSWLPYASHSYLKRDTVVANSVPGSCPPGRPASCGPTLRALSAGVTALTTTGTQGEQSTNTIGVRWDFNKSAALKVQLDRISPKNGQGLFLTPTPGFTGPVTVLAAGVDFVF
jgi:hypothetical protein